MPTPHLLTQLSSDWQARLLMWFPSIGIPAKLVTAEQLLRDNEARAAAGSQLCSASWWDGRVLHLAEDPPHRALEWLYLAAHAGLAHEPRRSTPDFGLFGLGDVDLSRVEAKARELVLGWAAQAGARGDNVWRLTKEWKMTGAAMVFDKEAFADTIHVHLNQSQYLLDKKSEEIRRWGSPQPPKLWIETKMEF